MSIDAERIAFDTIMIENFDGELPIRFGTMAEDDAITKGDQLWLQCKMRSPGQTKQHGMGTESKIIMRRLGAYLVHMWDRASHGKADIYRLIDRLEPLFIGKLINNGQTEITRITCLPLSPYKGWHGEVLHIAYRTTFTLDR